MPWERTVKFTSSYCLRFNVYIGSQKSIILYCLEGLKHFDFEVWSMFWILFLMAQVFATLQLPNMGGFV